MHTPIRPAAFFRPGCLLTCMVSGEENLLKVAQVSRVCALAAALARMCMTLSRAVSLKNTKHTDFKLKNTWKVNFCICEVSSTEKPELSNYSADDARGKGSQKGTVDEGSASYKSVKKRTCRHGHWRPDTMQPPLLVLGAPAELDGTSRGPLLPAVRAEPAHTGPPGETAPTDTEPSRPPGGTDNTSDLYILETLTQLETGQRTHNADLP